MQITKKQERGLKYALDDDGNGLIQFLEWDNFFQRFEKSGLGMDDYMLKLESECPPNKYELVQKYAFLGTSTASEMAKKAKALARQKTKDVSAMVANVDIHAEKEKAKEKAKGMMGSMGKSMGKSMGSMGRSMFGSSKKKKKYEVAEGDDEEK